MSSVFEIPTSYARRSFELSVPLDGRLFRLIFAFNSRDSFWYLDIENTLTGAPVKTGLKVIAQWDLLRLARDSSRPDGSLVPVSLGAVPEANTVEALGRDIVLTYVGES